MIWDNLTIFRRWHATPLGRRNMFIILAVIVFLALYILFIPGDPAACEQLRREQVTDYRDSAEHFRLAAECNPLEV